MKKITLIVIGILLAALVFFGYKGFRFYQKIYKPGSNNTTKAEKTSYNILLFGYGGGNHEGAYLTDTIMLAHIDLKNKKAALISIPRDLWIKLPTKSGAEFHTKINSIYQLESDQIGDISKVYPDIDTTHFGTFNDAEYTKYVLGRSFGITIDNYVAVDFQGFTKAIDVLGGVDVNVTTAFTDPQYPIDGKENDLCTPDVQEKFTLIKDYINSPSADQNVLQQLFKDHKSTDKTKDLETFFKNIIDEPETAFPCRYETLRFEKGITHMDGTTALKFARSRHALQDGTDFGRSARQQRLLQSVKDKVLSINFIPKIIPLIDELGNHVKMDFGINEINKFMRYTGSVKEFQLTQFVLSDKNLLMDSFSKDGQFILVPLKGANDWSELQMSIQNIFNGILPTPTPSYIATPSAALKK
ncbi:MAG: LCP family protein [bacterium]|nr:LCP family protein [bacterium]